MRFSTLSSSITAAVLTSCSASASSLSSAVLDWSTGLAPEPGQELSASAGYAFLQTERAALGATMSLIWTEGFAAESPSLLTGALAATLFWKPSIENHWLLSAEPFLIHRTADSVAAVTLPGIRLSAEYLRIDDRFTIEYSDERTLPARAFFEALRGRRQTLKAGWASTGRHELRIGMVGLKDTIIQYSTLGPEVAAWIQLTPRWRSDFLARFGIGRSSIPLVDSSASESLASIRIHWLFDPSISTRIEFSRSSNPENEEWSSVAGISWSIL